MKVYLQPSRPFTATLTWMVSIALALSSTVGCSDTEGSTADSSTTGIEPSSDGPDASVGSDASDESASVAGYLFTSLNGEGENQVVSFERYSDGTIGQQRAYATGSQGGADRSAGGDAAGDFDSQGAIQVIEDHLLVVNAGGNEVSVFELDRPSGTLELRQNVSSGGVRPVSIAPIEKLGEAGEYWVLVGNQWNNPNVQKGGPGEGPLEFYPDEAFHADGGPHEQVLPERNLYLFSFDAASGELSPEGPLDTYPGTHGGPATVAFSPDGSRIAVSTWGIAHFGTEEPTHQRPSRVYVYDFDQQTGAVSGERYFEQTGVSGSIGLSWDTRTPTLFVSNFNLVPESRDHSLTVLYDDGQAVEKVANFGTGEGEDIDEACWTALDPSGSKLYVSSFGGNFISAFDVLQDGSVATIGGGEETVYEGRAMDTPAGDTKDMLVSADGRFLYNLGAYQTFTISKFDINGDGSLSLDLEYPVEAATESGAGAYNFLGLAGYDL